MKIRFSVEKNHVLVLAVVLCTIVSVGYVDSQGTHSWDEIDNIPADVIDDDDICSISGNTASCPDGNTWVDDDENYCAGGTCTGDLYMSGYLGVGMAPTGDKLSVQGANSNNLFQIRRDEEVRLYIKNSNEPYIDFSNDATTDYDARILAEKTVWLGNIYTVQPRIIGATLYAPKLILTTWSYYRCGGFTSCQRPGGVQSYPRCSNQELIGRGSPPYCSTMRRGPAADACNWIGVQCATWTRYYTIG